MRLLIEYEFGKKNDLRYRTNFGNFITKHIKKTTQARALFFNANVNFNRQLM